MGRFSASQPRFSPILGHIFRFSARNPLNRLEMRQTKARNGFSALKIGGYHVASPWDPFLLTQKPSCRARRLVRVCVHGLAQARALTLRSTPEPIAGTGKGAFGSQGLTTWYPPILRVPNQFLAFYYPGFKLSGVLWAENLKVEPNLGQDPGQTAGNWLKFSPKTLTSS